MTGLNRRQARLLAAIEERGEVAFGDVHRVLRGHGVPKRRTVRRDLGVLRRAGLLHQSGTSTRRTYVLTQKGAA